VTLPPLLVLTDRAQLPDGRDLVATVARCADAGLETVVLRELDLRDQDRDALATALSAHVRVIAARTRLPAAHGVHLAATQTGLDARGVPLRGRSCHGVEDVWRATAAGAGYVTVSPVAASASKPGYGPALTPATVRRAAAAAHAGEGAALFALGGVDTGNAAAMREAGADGVAVMGAVMRAEDPAAEVARLLERVR
jgi:thiamine-phosphate pyrophosphorylase